MYTFSVSLWLKTYQDVNVPIFIKGVKLYRIGEALTAASVSRATYFRWLKQKRITDTQYKDRNGRRVFTDEELESLRKESQRLIESAQLPIKFQQ